MSGGSSRCVGGVYSLEIVASRYAEPSSFCAPPRMIYLLKRLSLRSLLFWVKLHGKFKFSLARSQPSEERNFTSSLLCA